MTLSDQWADVLRRRRQATVEAISVPVDVLDWLERVRSTAAWGYGVVNSALDSIKDQPGVSDDARTALAALSDSLGMDVYYHGDEEAPDA